MSAVRQKYFKTEFRATFTLSAKQGRIFWLIGLIPLFQSLIFESVWEKMLRFTQKLTSQRTST